MLVGRSDAGTPAMSWPSIAIRPLSGFSKPAICFSSVVLPQPDGPTSATNSPRSTLRLTPFSANAAPSLLFHIDNVEDRVLPHAPCSAPRCKRTIDTTLSPVIPRLGLGIHEFACQLLGLAHRSRGWQGRSLAMTAECLRDIARPTAPTPAPPTRSPASRRCSARCGASASSRRRATCSRPAGCSSPRR